ncbi:hypothetical protein CCACVL1_25719 [Corchorus capsularis]|uniref:Uncharacterized protein n=1 Tax=Corchorus capsularis TaxID=210143 RepID=A0A1R3GHV0_COCAP|nr:hypothetical protein CCACVL1_25719 [Corchorus capsularis]
MAPSRFARCRMGQYIGRKSSAPRSVPRSVPR